MKWLLISALLLPGWAIAQDVVPAPDKPTPKTMAELYPPLPGVEYYCTNSDGQRVDLGGVICITASCITWMARCEMVSAGNMAIWRKTQDGCPGATLFDRLQGLKPAV